jgi:glutamate synthase (NADPH/NADH) small chain
VQALWVAEAEANPPFGPKPDTERELPAELVLLAMGFLHPEPALLEELGVERDARGNALVRAPYTTSVEGVFAAGDARRGQSLIVWAINEGRQCARMVDRYLASRAGQDDQRPVRSGNVEPADEGPEGPPQHVGPGVGAED